MLWADSSRDLRLPLAVLSRRLPLAVLSRRLPLAVLSRRRMGEAPAPARGSSVGSPQLLS